MLEAGAAAPRDRDALAERLHAPMRESHVAQSPARSPRIVSSTNSYNYLVRCVGEMMGHPPRSRQG